MKTIKEIKQELESRKDRSAWRKGVAASALELLDELEENRKFSGKDEYMHSLEIESELLNGANNWNMYSWGGSSLIYDCDIAKRLCCPSELQITRGGERRPNSREEWLDVQARALYQACSLIKFIARF